MERFPLLTFEEIMALINLPTDHLRGTRFGQELIEEGRLEGEARGRAAEAASVALRQLNLLCGPLSETTTARIQALLLAQLESLADALLDYRFAGLWLQRPCRSGRLAGATRRLKPQRRHGCSS